jgi:3-oxoacyl-[acyl-carrier-protein] synthase II
MDHSGLKIDESNHDRVGVTSAPASAASTSSSASTRRMLAGRPRKISPFFIPGSIINLAAGHVSIRFGARGPNEATATACTSRRTPSATPSASSSAATPTP